MADLGRGRIVPFDPPPVNWTATFVGVLRPSCFVGLNLAPVMCLAGELSAPPPEPPDDQLNWRAIVVPPVC